MKHLLLFFLCSILFISGVTSVFAQALTSLDIEQELGVQVIPQAPKAGERASITLQSSSYNLNAAMISWTMNGKKVTAGEGYTTFEFQNADLGNQTTITATITPLNARSFSRTFTFTPTDVAIIWQAESYTPPLYQGKALFTDGSRITASAVPYFIQNGKRLNKENLIYNWTLGGDPLQSKSGYGKHTITIVGNNLGSEEALAVSVTTRDGALQGSASITLKPESTRVVFYENHPLFGTLFTTGLENTFALTDTEVSLMASPYFFSDSDPFYLLNFSWTVNGKKAGTEETANMITLRNDEGTSGSSMLGLQIVHKENSFQNTKKQLRINLSPRQ